MAGEKKKNDEEREEESVPEPSGSAAPSTEASEEPLSDADLAALGAENTCQARRTEVAFPSFAYDNSGRGAIKINGKLIPVTASASGEYANGELRIRTRLLDDEGDAGLQMQELIVAGPRMKDEFGFWGYTTCGNSEACTRASGRRLPSVPAP